MPNFDGNGPLKRGRAVGRGPGPCEKNEVCTSCERIAPVSRKDETGPA
jgi:hypothetical protein